MDVASTIRNLSLGDHLCCLYETEDEHRAILTPFIRSGLERGEKVLYIVDARTAEAVFSSLNEKGLDVSASLAAGQLAVADSRDTYTREGRFDPDRMLDLLQCETARALEEGYTALRLTGEMSWALRGLPGSDRLMEYEAKLNRFFPMNAAIGLCQYDMRRFDPAILLDVLATHPIAIVRSQGYDNMYYVPPEEFLGANREQAELERRLRNLEERRLAEEERARMEEALRRSEEQARRDAAFINAVFDTAGALIVVLDREGRIVRFNRTCEKLTGYRETEVQGKGLWDVFIPAEEADSVRAVFKRLRSGEFPNRRENSWITRDGGRIRVAWSNTCLLGEANEVEHIVSIGLDVTESALREQARQREFSALEAYSGAAEADRTAASLGLAPLRQARKEHFQNVVADFESLMDQSMEQALYKVQRDVSGKLRRMAERLGSEHAGPRDVVQAYIQAIQNKTKGEQGKKAQAYMDEGRLLLLELMGYLAASYYNRCLRGRSQSTHSGEGMS